MQAISRAHPTAASLKLEPKVGMLHELLAQPSVVEHVATQSIDLNVDLRLDMSSPLSHAQRHACQIQIQMYECCVQSSAWLRLWVKRACVESTLISPALRLSPARVILPTDSN